VSGNEVKAALDYGFPADQVVFAGVGKTDNELKLALHHCIQSINVESIQEMEVINELASAMGMKARISLRLIPNVDAHTHRYITTGLEENKFGILPWQFDTVLEKLRSLEKLELQGLHFHIGSQITDLDVFKSLCERANEINAWFMEQGYLTDIINVGADWVWITVNRINAASPILNPTSGFSMILLNFRAGNNFTLNQAGPLWHNAAA